MNSYEINQILQELGDVMKDAKVKGLVRRIDELGRIVIPKDILNELDIHHRDALVFSTDSGRIVIQKYRPNCVFCNNAENLTLFRNKWVCGDCLKELQK